MLGPTSGPRPNDIRRSPLRLVDGPLTPPPPLTPLLLIIFGLSMLIITESSECSMEAPPLRCTPPKEELEPELDIAFEDISAPCCKLLPPPLTPLEAEVDDDPEVTIVAVEGNSRCRRDEVMAAASCARSACGKGRGEVVGRLAAVTVADVHQEGVGGDDC